MVGVGWWGGGWGGGARGGPPSKEDGEGKLGL
eukprot:COSAG04_NODE_20954_length_382_cov_1.809187_2_plen_31_part_01